MHQQENAFHVSTDWSQGNVGRGLGQSPGAVNLGFPLIS